MKKHGNPDTRKKHTTDTQPAIHKHADDNEDFGPPMPSSTAKSDSTWQRLVWAAVTAADGDLPAVCSSGSTSPEFKPSVPYKEAETIVKYERPNIPSALGSTEWSLGPYYTVYVKCDRNNGVWKASIIDVKSGQRQFIGASDNVLDDMKIDAAEYDKDCKTLRQMQKDLTDTIASPSGTGNALKLWLPDDFVKAHEDVHRKLNSDSAKKHYDEAVTAVVAITRPCKDFQDSDAAEKDMKKELDKAMKDMKEAIDKDYKSSNDHKPAKSFTDAHASVLQPWLDKVNDAIKRAKCP